jgi:hypothetical protein
MMILLVFIDGACPINLLGQYHPDELVGEDKV